MADLLGSMRVEIVGDNSKLDKSIKTSKDNTEKFGKSTASLGKSLSGMFAGIGFAVVAKKLFDLGKQAENLFKVQELAEAKLDQTLIATGNAAGLTADELKRMATGLQEVTTFGDEAIIGAESLLLTFKDIGGNVFPRALESILDVSTAMGQDLKSSTVQIGKALNAPVEGLAALSRVGIQFTEDQKDLIKGFVETGDKASAQTVILKELESQFGGVARAVTLTADGVSQQLDNSFGDLLETIGGVISEGLTPYRENLRLEVESVNNSITAHLIRKKALAGNATEIEALTLAQIEQEKTENKLAQALENIEAAESQVLNTRGLSAIQIERINLGKEAAIKVANNTVIALEDELVLRKLTTETAQDAVDVERERTEANILFAEGLQEITDLTDDNTESTEENTVALNDNSEATFRNVNTIRDYPEQLANAQFAHREFTEAVISDNAEIELSGKDLWLKIGGEAISTLSAIDQFSSAVAASELQQLKDRGASEDELNKKKKEIARETAIRDKLIGLFSIGINTASAIAEASPIIPLMILAGIAGGIQTAAVLATPVPSFAQGGIVAGNNFVGDNVPAMVNSGEMIINRNDQSALMDFIKGGSNQAGGGMTHIVVNLDKKPIIDTVSRASKNGTMIIDARSVH